MGKGKMVVSVPRRLECGLDCCRPRRVGRSTFCGARLWIRQRRSDEPEGKDGAARESHVGSSCSSGFDNKDGKAKRRETLAQAQGMRRGCR